MKGNGKKNPFLHCSLYRSPPEPHPLPSACYITAVWPHSMNTLIQRWLSWQQCDRSSLTLLLSHWPSERAAAPVTRRLTCQSAERHSQAQRRSCSTDTVSHSAKRGRSLRGQPGKEHNLVSYRLEGGTKSDSDSQKKGW